MSNNSPRPTILTNINPTVTRIFAELAAEIGLSESIVLAQISFWVETSTGDVFHDGKWWTYQSLSAMKEKAFPYWNVSTISRIVNKLAENGYIFIGNYNKRKGDATQWYALNLDKLSTLKSIKVFVGGQIYEPIAECNSLLQNAIEESTAIAECNSLLQNATTLPQTPTQTPNKDKNITPRPASPNIGENQKSQNIGFQGFVPNGSGAAKDSSSESNDRVFSKLEEILRQHGVARLTESQAKKIKNTGLRVKEDGTTEPMPSPHDYIEQGNVTFEKFLAFVVNSQKKYNKDKNPSRQNIVNHIIGYSRKDGWIAFEAKYGHIDNTTQESGIYDESLDPLSSFHVTI